VEQSTQTQEPQLIAGQPIQRSEPRPAGPIPVRVGCDFIYESAFETPMMLIVRPRDSYWHTLVDEHRILEPNIPVQEYIDGFGNHVWRLIAPQGQLRIRYDALAHVPSDLDPYLPDLPRTPIEETPDDALVYILPSRYGQSDLLVGDAWSLFGNYTPGWEQVQAVCDWIHSNITYAKGSDSTTTAHDVYQVRQGVCRDFAHIGVTLCRALNYPARYVCGYLPEIDVVPDPTPMDFHAWFEVFIDGAWRTFDARHNQRRIGRVLIGMGRDAVDVAFATMFGNTRLTRMVVWADEVAPSFTLDRSS
jgi:transglutaminase-like putative cysteine protease